MHRIHHAFADKDGDPHSPLIDKDLFAMMWRTRKVYLEINQEVAVIGDKFKKEFQNGESSTNLPKLN